MDTAILARLDALEARCSALEGAQSRPEAAPAQDRAIRIKEACARMGWTYSWAVKRWAKLGGYRDLDGKLKILASTLGRP